MAEIALVTCARLPDLDTDDRLLIEPLAALGHRAVAVVWDDPNVDWDRFDLSVIRSTWDYTDRRDAFVAWARSVPRLHNPAEVVAWNTDKRYLVDLAAAGLSVVPTSWITDEPVVLPMAGAHVLKPAVGAGSMDAARFTLHDAHEAELARAHAARLVAAGQTVMVQPFAEAIEAAGETGVILIDGVVGHAVRKGPMLRSTPTKVVDGLFLEEEIEARAASPEEVELAMAAVAAVPGGVGGSLLYARVDMVAGADGRPMLMELELTEPSLFMVTHPPTAQRFATAIANRLVK